MNNILYPNFKESTLSKLETVEYRVESLSQEKSCYGNTISEDFFSALSIGIPASFIILISTSLSYWSILFFVTLVFTSIFCVDRFLKNNEINELLDIVEAEGFIVNDDERDVS
jgi:hypothetical protein